MLKAMLKMLSLSYVHESSLDVFKLHFVPSRASTRVPQRLLAVILHEGVCLCGAFNFLFQPPLPTIK